MSDQLLTISESVIVTFYRELKRQPRSQQIELVTALCSDVHEPRAAPLSHDDRVLLLSALAPADLAFVDILVRFLFLLSKAPEDIRRAVLTTLWDAFAPALGGRAN